MKLVVVSIVRGASPALLVEDRDAPRNKWGDFPKAALTVSDTDEFEVGDVVDMVVRKRQ